MKILREEKNILEVSMNEDLGLASLVAEKLNEEKKVEVATASIDHPLKGNAILKVKGDSPKKALASVLKELQKELDVLAKEAVKL